MSDGTEDVTKFKERKGLFDFCQKDQICQLFYLGTPEVIYLCTGQPRYPVVLILLVHNNIFQ